MNWLLEKAKNYIEKAMEFERDSKYTLAKKSYLMASECLFKAARESKGRIKEIRFQNAEKLLKKADSIRIREEQHQKEREKEERVDATKWIVAERPNVKFEDIAGLEDAKEEIRIKIIYPFSHPERAKKYGISSGGGILLYGPPGTGKTFIAKAVASEVSAVFFSIKPSDIMSKWVGEAEQNIAELFKTARIYDKSVIFIDEVEALLPKRRDSESTVMKRVVPQILAEMDGLESDNRNILFIGATNEPWALDPAVLRPGRFSEKVYIPPPNFESRKKIFELHLRGKPLSEDIDLNKLAEMSEGYSGADIKQICFKASIIPFKEAIETGIEREIRMSDLETAMKLIKPSINQRDLKRFEEFRFT